MDVFVFVLAIIAITTVGGIYREKMKNEAKAAKHQNNGELDARFADMEERIQTLERIVTDQKTQLKDKIEAL
jgi:cell division protein FtsB